MKIKLHFTDSESVRALRKKLEKNQSDFWKPLGVTQSGGSRYESGRGIPKPIQLLLEVVYGSSGEKLLVELRPKKKDE
jgi:hypothetical protein